MTELSPAAQAVLDAANLVFGQTGTTAQGIAAAIRAAADQVVPKPIRLPRNSYAEGAYDQRINDHQCLLAIATELEGHC